MSSPAKDYDMSEKQIPSSDYTPLIVSCTLHELITIMRSSKVPLDTKLGSMLYNVYRYTQPYLLKICKLLDFEEAEKIFNLPIIPYATNSNETIAFKSMIGLLMLGFAFIESGKLDSEVTSYTTTNNDTSINVQRFIKEFHFIQFVSTPIIREMLGFAICINSKGKVDPMVSRDGLIKIEDYVRLFSMPVYETKIIEKARSLYANHHICIIRALHSFISDKRLLVQTNQEILADLTYLSSLKNSFTKQPYLVLQRAIPLEYSLNRPSILDVFEKFVKRKSQDMFDDLYAREIPFKYSYDCYLEEDNLYVSKDEMRKLEKLLSPSQKKLAESLASWVYDKKYNL